MDERNTVCVIFKREDLSLRKFQNTERERKTETKRQDMHFSMPIYYKMNSMITYFH